MASPAGPRYGATSSWARSLISQDSGSGPATSIARHCRPTTIPLARSTKRENTSKPRLRLRAHPAGNNPVSTGKLKAAQSGGLFVRHISRHYQYLKCLPHAFGADQVVQLKSDLGPLLRKLALLERVSKLGFFPDAH